MSLRRKTFLAMLLMMAVLLLLLYVVLRSIMLTSFGNLEREVVLRNLDRASNTFTDDIDHLGRAILDWSSWDESYQFVQDGSPEYITTNLPDGTFSRAGHQPDDVHR